MDSMRERGGGSYSIADRESFDIVIVKNSQICALIANKMDYANIFSD